MTIDYREKYRNISHLFGGYLHQSWEETYIWEGKEPRYQPIIRKYKTEDDQEGINVTIDQLKDIIKIGNGLSNDEWLDVLTWGLNLSGYYPPGDNLTYEEWLKEVLGILEEPMEETLKHWIPKRIRE